MPASSASSLFAAQPRLLEQRADDVATVADDVDDLRLRVREWERAREMCELGRLLDGADRADEPGTARDRRIRRRRRGSLGGCERRELWDRGLDRRDLAEVDESGQRADRPGEERRPRPRRPDDEHEAVVQAAEALAERGAAPAVRAAWLREGGSRPASMMPGHGAILAVPCGASARQPSTSMPCSGPSSRAERRETCGSRTRRCVSGCPAVAARAVPR